MEPPGYPGGSAREKPYGRGASAPRLCFAEGKYRMREGEAQ
jgi:hypothetical protein